MKRVMVIGGPGAGKSTFAKRLHKITCLPLFHLDQLYWRPGWTATPEDEWLDLMAGLAAREEWIMDGGYSGTFPIRMPRAGTILWLDIPRRIAFPRVLRRTIAHFGRTRDDIAPGCPESFDWTFLKWSWTWHNHHAAKYRLALANYATHATVRVFASNGEAGDFLADLSR